MCSNFEENRKIHIYLGKNLHMVVYKKGVVVITMNDYFPEILI